MDSGKFINNKFLKDGDSTNKKRKRVPGDDGNQPKKVPANGSTLSATKATIGSEPSSLNGDDMDLDELINNGSAADGNVYCVASIETFQVVVETLAAMDYMNFLQNNATKMQNIAKRAKIVKKCKKYLKL